MFLALPFYLFHAVYCRQFQHPPCTVLVLCELRSCETQYDLQYSNQYLLEHSERRLYRKKSLKVSNKTCLPCPTVTRESPLRRMCPFYLNSNTTKHRGTRVKKLCTEQWYDSRNCQMASLLCSKRSPGGFHKHLFPLFAATTVI